MIEIDHNRDILSDYVFSNAQCNMRTYVHVHPDVIVARVAFPRPILEVRHDFDKLIP